MNLAARLVILIKNVLLVFMNPASFEQKCALWEDRDVTNVGFRMFLRVRFERSTFASDLIIGLLISVIMGFTVMPV